MLSLQFTLIVPKKKIHAKLNTKHLNFNNLIEERKTNHYLRIENQSDKILLT